MFINRSASTSFSDSQVIPVAWNLVSKIACAATSGSLGNKSPSVSTNDMPSTRKLPLLQRLVQSAKIAWLRKKNYTSRARTFEKCRLSLFGINIFLFFNRKYIKVKDKAPENAKVIGSLLTKRIPRTTALVFALDAFSKYFLWLSRSTRGKTTIIR